MAVDVGQYIRTAIVTDSALVSLLPTYLGAPAVFNRHPSRVPGVHPQITISTDIDYVDEDALNAEHDLIIRYVYVYGIFEDHYRDVEDIGYELRRLFHRQRRVIEIPGKHVARLICDGPVSAQVSDDNLVGRMVALNMLIGDA